MCFNIIYSPMAFIQSIISFLCRFWADQNLSNFRLKSIYLIAYFFLRYFFTNTFWLAILHWSLSIQFKNYLLRPLPHHISSASQNYQRNGNITLENPKQVVSQAQFSIKPKPHESVATQSNTTPSNIQKIGRPTIVVKQPDFPKDYVVSLNNT